jgi:hypothetical protein
METMVESLPMPDGRHSLLEGTLTGIVLLGLLAGAGCSKGSYRADDDDTSDPDGGSDADTDSDSDADADSDSDGDCDLAAVESFTEAALPTGWQIEDYDSDGYGQTWTRSTADNTTGGSGGYYLVDSTGTIADFDDRLITDAYERGGCSTVVLAFNHDYKDRDTTDTGRIDLQAGEGDWQTVHSYTADAEGPAEFDLSSYIGASSSFRVRFRYLGNNDYHWKIDDVRITGDPD